MLDAQIKTALTEYFSKLTHPVTFRLSSSEQTEHLSHPKRKELITFLSELVDLSDKLKLVENHPKLRSGVSFALISPATEDSNTPNQSTGEATESIVFSGIPGGHEFNSLILAILHTGGVALKLGDTVRDIVKAIDTPLHFETVMSLTCHNCPDVVQLLNDIALLNPHITHEVIEGGTFPKLVEDRKIMGVPAVFLNGNSFANGKITEVQIIEKLMGYRSEKSSTSANAKPDSYDVVVIGGGPAGVSSAIYTARKGLRVAIIADRIGGQVRDTMDIENYIAIPKTNGQKLSGDLKEHLGHNDVKVFDLVKVNTIKVEREKKVITFSTGDTLDTRSIIIATGAKWRELNVPGESENIGKGVAYCPHCDGPFFKGKDVAVVGGGNSGVEATLDLAGIVKSVTLLEYSDKLIADDILVRRLQQTKNIKVILNANTKQIDADTSGVTGITYEDRVSKKIESISLSAVFIQIGLIPNSGFLNGIVETTKYGEIIIDEKCRTNVPGIFACGDVTTVPYKQIVIAVGEGAKAGIGVFEYLTLHESRGKGEVGLSK